jgi:tRNA (mo5U34)-methyltransferase
MNTDELKGKVSAVTWWHTIDLGSGVITPGQDDTPDRISRLAMPDDLTGLTVLDIGAWDGAYSFEAERRGARRVLATDSYCWGGSGWGTKAGFDLARAALDSKVEDMELDVMELDPGKIGVFDLVLFLGVLYHLRHPLLALERVFSVTGKQLILETQVDMLECSRAVMAFYPNAELDGDPAIWWGPNRTAVEAMLTVVGFKEVKLISHDEKISRMVFHAWR